MRRDIAGVEQGFSVVMRPGISGQAAPIGDRLFPGAPLRRIGPAFDVGESRLVRGDEAGAGAGFDRHVADRHAAFHRHRAERAAGKFDDVAGAAGGADLADDREDHVLRADPGAERPVDLDQHVLGMRLDQRLGRQHMLDLGGADAEGQRSQRAVRRGVAVAAHDGHAGLAQPLLRPDDVDDALIDAVDREIGHAELDDIALQRVDLQLRFRLVDAGGAVAGRDVVVGDGDRRVRPAHLAAGELQPLEGLRRRDLVAEMQVDIEEVGALARRGDDMAVPDLIEQGARLRHIGGTPEIRLRFRGWRIP